MAVVAKTREFTHVAARDAKRRIADAIYVRVLTWIGLGTATLILLLIGSIVWRGLPAMSWEFLSSPPLEHMTKGGIWPMVRGSILLMIGTFLLALPIGVLGGICLAEYAGRTRFSALMRACVTSLAGTPSIIYGLFGLAIFVLMLKLKISLLAGWLTLALMAMPVIILATENAIKAVPETFYEAGVALGLSRWQTMAKIVLPHALPGILTGVVLATGRAAGEAPPILLTAGLYYSTGSLSLGWDTLRKPVANLPYHLAEGYRQGEVIPEKIIWGTCLTLMLFVLSINLISILVRARIRRKQQW